MIYRKEIYPESFYQSNLFDFYFGDLNIGIIDIETTGLSPDRSSFILGGLVIPDPEGKSAIQIFSESKEEEPQLLRSYLSELKDLDVLISYNGDHFDLPFLSRRTRHNRISLMEFTGSSNFFQYPTYQSLDLYRILDRYSDLRKLLPNLKQKTVETFLGLWLNRTDEISGGESVELYNRFLRTGDPALRDIIMLHNKDDILQLSRMLKIFEKLDLHKIMFHNGFVISQHEMRLTIRSIIIQKDSLLVSGTHRNIPMDYRCYTASHEAAFSIGQGNFTVRIPFKNKSGYFYIDLEEFKCNCSALEKYPGYESGYLLVKEGEHSRYAEINHLIKILLKEILTEVWYT